MWQSHIKVEGYCSVAGFNRIAAFEARHTTELSLRVGLIHAS